MKTKLMLTGAIAILCGLFSTHLVAQENEQKATIKIITKENGKVSEIEKEIRLSEGELIEQILEENGIYQEIEISEPGEDVEVIIRKRKESNNPQNLEKEIRVEVFNGLESLDQLDEHIRLMVEESIEKAEPRAFLGVYGKMNIHKEIIENENGEIAIKSPKSEEDAKVGVEITGVVESSPAQKAGIQEGDIIKKIDGKELMNFGELASLIKSKKPGEEIKIELITKKGEEKTLSVTLDEKQPEIRTFHTKKHPNFYLHEENFTKKPFLGITLDEEMEEGIKIGKAIENSTAKEIGMQSGDILQKLNGKQIKTFDDLKNVLSSLEVGEEVEVEFIRDGEKQIGKAKLKSRVATKGMESHFEFDLDDQAKFNYIFMGDEAPKKVIVKEVRINITMDDVSKSEAKELKKTMGVDVSENSLFFDEFLIAPNPTAGNLKISFTPSQNGKIDLMLVDQSGKQVHAEQFNATATNYQKELNLETQPNGIYYLILKQADQTFTKKIIKQ